MPYRIEAFFLCTLMFTDVIRIFRQCCLFQASPSFVSLPCAIHLTMDSLLSGASKGASGIQSEQTPSRHRYHLLSLALYDWPTEIIQLGFPVVWTKEPCIRCCPSASFGCCLLPWHWMKTHYWTVCPAELCLLSVSQNQCCETMPQSVSTSVDSQQLIAKQSVTASSAELISHLVSRRQHSPVSRGGSVQLLHHAVERRSKSAGGGCQGGNICTWPEWHLQETFLGKNLVHSNTRNPDAT